METEAENTTGMKKEETVESKQSPPVVSEEKRLLSNEKSESETKANLGADTICDSELNECNTVKNKEEIIINPNPNTRNENDLTELISDSEAHSILSGTENDDNNEISNSHDVCEINEGISTDNNTKSINNEGTNVIENDLITTNSEMEIVDIESFCSNKENDSTKDTPVRVQMKKSLENSGSGLAAIAAQYNSCSDESENETSSDSIEIIAPNDITICEHRTVPYVISSSDSDSSDSDIEIVNVTQNRHEMIYNIDGNDEESENNRFRGPIRAKGEILLEDLPAIEDLHITVPEQECIELGKIHSIVEQLVLVDCIPGTAALDLETVLFLEKGNKVLGEVFDVIGQVCSPLYCVRFNSNKQIKEKGIEVGQIVYVAPRTEHTHFLILSNLMSIRGSDASWENDVEPPETHLDYSDDEEERNAKRIVRSRRQRSEECEEGEKREEPMKKKMPYRSQQQRQSSQGNHSSPSMNQTIQQQQQSSYQYNTANTTWHSNYSQTSNVFPNPYSPQFNPVASYNNPTPYPTPFNYPQFHPPINTSGNFIPENQNPSFFPPNPQLSPYPYQFPPPPSGINQNQPGSFYPPSNRGRP